MGEIYRARDKRLERDVAIKVLPAHLAQDPDALARFEREATSVPKLSHPNILSIFEFGQDASGRFVVTELVDGETLRSSPDNRMIYYGALRAEADIWIGSHLTIPGWRARTSQLRSEVRSGQL